MRDTSNPDDDCIDCGENVMQIMEYSYMVKAQVWESAGMPRPSRAACEIACLLFEAGLISLESTRRHLDSGGKLCIGCLEKRLGRQLKRKDFKMSIPLNNFPWSQSERLQSRISA